MILSYGLLFGGISVIALVVNGMMIVAAMSLTQATLTTLFPSGMVSSSHSWRFTPCQGGHLETREINLLTCQDQVRVVNLVASGHLVGQAHGLLLADGLLVLPVMGLDQTNQGVAFLCLDHATARLGIGQQLPKGPGAACRGQQRTAAR